MHGRRRAGLALAPLVAALALLLTAVPANAARNLAGVPGNLTEQAVSPSFVVHYTTAPGDPNAIDSAAALRVAQNAERALGDATGRLNFPPPPDDGDGHVDLYVFHDADRTERGLVRADSREDQTTGWIAVPPNATGDIAAVAHQVFHVLQLGIYRPAGVVLAEGSATWAALHLYAAELGTDLPGEAQFFPDDPLDCTDATRCSRPGHASWQFFELLAERYGDDVVRRIYDRSQTLGASDHRSHFLPALQDFLAERQTTLRAAFADFTRTNLVGAYALPGLSGRRYGATEPFDDLATGTRTRRFRSHGVTLDHLAAAFYRLRSGGDRAGSPTRCASAKLILTITGPADIETPIEWAKFRPRASAPRPLGLKSGSGKVTLPWSTCRGRELGLAFLNPSTTVDDRVFSLRAELRVAAKKRRGR